MKRTIVLIGMLLVARPAFAQVDVVQHVKTDLVARGVNLAGTCGAFEITKRVAWILRAQGWGYIAATGEACGGFRGDKLVSTTGRFVDLLIDQGNTNGPAWQERPASMEELAARVEPMDPGDAPVSTGPPIVVPPTSGPPTALSIDYDKIAALIKADGELTRAKVDEPGWFVKIAGNRYVQMAVAALGTCFASTDCRHGLFGGGNK